MDMRENFLGYREAVRKYWKTQSRNEEELYKDTVKKWERIYLEEGAEGLMKEKRGKAKLLQQRENFRQTKRNESGAIPNSFTSNLIFNFV